ncbi:MAG: GNAT family N-acetyltransferase [Clostridia bacterium]|nr:GNAT family N-acetyltransferase [Clostridia bacterium]
MSLENIIKGLTVAIENVDDAAASCAFTNKEILKIAMEQSAADLCADEGDFLKSENVIVISQNREDARRYLKLPFSCQLVSYGNNAVASVSPEFREIAEKYINSYPVEHLFETPNMHALNETLMEKGQKICFMAEYFLPDINVLRPLDCPYELRVLTQKDFTDLYLPEWSNALCENRKHLDVLGVGVYDSGRLVGLAGCSADCDSMWQIGVDVLPEYRRQGIASAITSRLAIEILNRGKVPFYCAAWSNVKSVRNAIKSGFRPAWVEMTAKSCEMVDSMNKLN